MSQEDVRFLEIMRNNICQNEEGFYEMPLPFKGERPNLPDNFQMAKRRLEQLKGRMKLDIPFASDYQQFVNKMILEGDAELVPEKDTDTLNGQDKWIIPHHGVYHKRKNKLRVVFDCAARFKGTCLNDHLLQGPDLTNTLLGCLLRFRQQEIALAGDIERMFYRFKVSPKDRDYLQFLWWDNDDIEHTEPKLYRMTVHLFGATSSPGCANFALKKLASDYKKEYSDDVCQFIRDNFYVDDGLVSCSTVEQAISLISGARNLCERANIRLHKLVSNSKSVMDAIPESERASNTDSLDLPAVNVERILGIQWNVKNDKFQFSITLNEKPMTRRGILSTVASVYDPLGCLAPFVLLGKQILQEMCRDKCDWDDPLSEELRPRWERWINELPKLAQIDIPRCYIPTGFGDTLRFELHHFSDASSTGYGQCSYLRVLNSQDEVSCCLILGKARVAPLKVTTIPRLELAAAVVSANMANVLRDELSYKISEEYFWTDSQITLGYINNDERRFHVFVANRIRQIRDSSKVKQWRYVKGEDNPADHASRGLYPEELVTSNWFKGPDFLCERVIPDETVGYKIDPEDPELKKVVVNIALGTKHTERNMIQRLEKFSCWSKVITAVAVIQRYLRKKDSPPTNADLANAELFILKLLQAEHFAEEIKGIKDKTLNTKNRLYKLDPFLDDSSVLRVGGRLQKSSLSYGIQHPIILPKSGHLVELIIRHCHQKIAHQGRGFTLNELRSRGYWILGCSKAVSSVIYKCVTCRKLRGRPQSQKMSQLPSDRTEFAPPFSYCGMDCFGPFMVKEGRRELKRYGLIVTCMASRAVHIECLDDMTTDCLINAL